VTWRRVTQYTLNAIPENLCGEDGCIDWYAWNVTVEWRGPGDVWAVKHHTECLGKNGRWSYEPSPSNRSTSWKQRHRFTEEEALRLAEVAAHKVCVNGLYPKDIVEKYATPTSERSS
jgi:hypothetical protein